MILWDGLLENLISQMKQLINRGDICLYSNVGIEREWNITVSAMICLIA